ncbi:MAG: transposase [Planctomycetaceae bacterium]|nr:transposase [Planctomycetales bacterium]MCB9921504.1 transposase [Planctomycetaceae bacterium]
MRWDSFNESRDFVRQVETYRRRFGCHLESVHVDQIYRTRANRAFCKENVIRMSGPPLGRPAKDISTAPLYRIAVAYDTRSLMTRP